MFDQIFKNLEVCQTYSATRGIFNFLLVVWQCCQTRSFVQFDILHERFYYIDTSALLENTPLVKFIRNYIRNSSGVFSIFSLVKIPMTSLISSLSLKLYLESLWQSSGIFGNFRKCSGTFVWPLEQFWKIFRNLRKVSGKHRHQYVYILYVYVYIL